MGTVHKTNPAFRDRLSWKDTMTPTEREQAFATIVREYTPQRTVVLKEIENALVGGDAVTGKTIERLTKAEAQDEIISHFKEIVETVTAEGCDNPCTEAYLRYTLRLNEEIVAAHTKPKLSWSDRAKVEAAKEFTHETTALEWV